MIEENIEHVGIEFYSRWKEYRLSDLMELIGGGTPKTSNPEYWGGAIPWLSVTDFNTGMKHCFDADKKITEKGLKESSTKILKKGQIIISARGTVGVISMLGRDMAFNQSNYGLNAKQELTSNEFLYYLLKANLASFISASYGAVFDTITKETFSQISILIPPIKEQTAIASILSSLDDKIDLLHRQNKTLEQLAETLFRQWFVEEAEESWEVSTLGKIGKVITGKTPSTKLPEYWGNDIPFITPSDFSEYFKYTNSSNRCISERGLNSMKNSIIPENSLIVTCIGSDMGKVAISTAVCVTNQQINSLILNADFPFIEYIYNYLKSIYNHLRNIAMGGTTMPIINKRDFENIEIQIPSRKLLFEFESITETYSRKIKSNQKQIRTLTQTQNTLLPKFMSGEVRVTI